MRVNKIYFSFADIEPTHMVSHIAVISSDKHVDLMNYLIKESTPTVQDITKPNLGENLNQGLENRIQTNWQLMLIILGVLLVLTFTYLGKCVHHHWTSRNFKVSNTNTAAPDITLNQISQIETFYERVQDIEYDEPERYLTAANDDIRGRGTIQNLDSILEKTEPMFINVVVEQTQDTTLTANNVIEKNEYENQPATEETNDLYITPCM